ncbi:hypothetical protein L218DRAFT_25183 [Marasmius fiardii PR-910]|nr:hypothetical protein L218DRAFT_25183 [Marasmius fiardii PR-910]
MVMESDSEGLGASSAFSILSVLLASSIGDNELAATGSSSARLSRVGASLVTPEVNKSTTEDLSPSSPTRDIVDASVKSSRASGVGCKGASSATEWVVVVMVAGGDVGRDSGKGVDVGESGWSFTIVPDTLGDGEGRVDGSGVVPLDASPIVKATALKRSSNVDFLRALGFDAGEAERWVLLVFPLQYWHLRLCYFVEVARKSPQLVETVKTYVRRLMLNSPEVEQVVWGATESHVMLNC